MQYQGDTPVFFATDLTHFLACRHLTALDRLSAHGMVTRPHFNDPMLELLRQRGMDHEDEYVRYLRESGKTVKHIDRNSRNASADTLDSMRLGVDVIVQARMESASWAGWADVLLRVPGTSVFGAWSYEPVETKMATETRGSTIMQLCLYAELLTEMQGQAPEILRVIVPGTGYEAQSFRFEEFRAYFRLIRRNFERELLLPLPNSIHLAQPYPEPISHCEICDWITHCEQRRQADDDVSQVAGMRRLQRQELVSWSVTTLAGLAALPLPLARKPARGRVESFTKLREQARLQLDSRQTGRLVYELLPYKPGEGLGELPAPAARDLFLDFEGDRLAEDGGFEYLTGYSFSDDSGVERYEHIYAFSPDEEKVAFERLIDLVIERRAQNPDMHVYHFGSYERTALKRLMGTYGTHAEELDVLLRGEVFVDLYSIVMRALRAGVDSYSIKRLEPLYGFIRTIELKSASRHLRAVEYAIATQNARGLTPEMLHTVMAYNRDDCVSAHRLRDWLEERRAELESTLPETIPRPAVKAGEAGEPMSAHLARIRDVADALLTGISTPKTPVEEATWLLAQILEWHRREDKAQWWEYFRLNDMTAPELLDERPALSGLEFRERLEVTPRGVVTDRYTFPPQETDFRKGTEGYIPQAQKKAKFGEVIAIDRAAFAVDIKKGAAQADRHPSALFKYDGLSNRDAVEALLKLGESVRDRNLDHEGPYQVARDLLLRRNPRLGEGRPLRLPNESTVDSARRVVLELSGGVFAIQGPPGAGKTFTGARMIVDLVRAGKRVGITAVSHTVIRNLMEAALEAAAEARIPLKCLDKVGKKPLLVNASIKEETDSGKTVAAILGQTYNVIGGTAWVWCKEALRESIDVLVVDEAGQMSLANVLACAQAARTLVLLGDPQQLEQPQKASHPEGSEVSALEYYLEGHETMPPDRGLFLGETWRLHPRICQFTSELFYEGKLTAHSSLGKHSILGSSLLPSAGLYFSPVIHAGNQNDSPEEVSRIVAIVEDLLSTSTYWTDRNGRASKLTMNDVLIVTPYNAQVGRILTALPGVRVGTVDRFQGQEAPVVIYSMASSSWQEAPHGMGFLFDRHRLNVATSRAQCACVLVANPVLFEPECRTPDQMRMANAYCRYLELATRIELKCGESYRP